MRLRRPTHVRRRSPLRPQRHAPRAAAGAGATRGRRRGRRLAEGGGRPRSRRRPRPGRATTPPPRDRPRRGGPEAVTTVSARGSSASTRRELPPLDRKPPTTTIRPRSVAAATSVRGSGRGDEAIHAAQLPGSRAPSARVRPRAYPSQATSRITTAATDATVTVTTFAISRRLSVVDERPPRAPAPTSAVARPRDSLRRAMM